MGNRLSKIYTRTGDDGSTGLGDGTRVPKDGARVEAYGTVDELNSCIGVLLAEQLPEALTKCLVQIQHELFDLGSELCVPGYSAITAEHVNRLERTLDGFNAELPPLKEFILPGGNRAAALCHVARTVCRRAERRTLTLQRESPLNGEVLRYLNRLSDLLFVLARVIARQDGSSEVLWKHERRNS
ncbi:MAG: cob(I)yrinic acid a,c-diamide adenosyltransferase [Gammaproteobacteria bacterium]